MKVLLQSDINRREKIKVFACGVVPVLYTKCVIKKHAKEFKKI